MASKKTSKKKEKKAESNLFFVKTIREKKEAMSEKVKNYKEKYVKDIFEPGLDFSKSIRKETGDFAGNLKKNVKAFGNGVKKTHVNFGGGVKKAGLEYGKILKNDAARLKDRIVEKGRKSIPNITVAKKLEGKITDGFHSVTSRVNLPSRTSIDKLNDAMETLIGKVDKLSGKSAV